MSVKEKLEEIILYTSLDENAKKYYWGEKDDFLNSVYYLKNSTYWLKKNRLNFARDDIERAKKIYLHIKLKASEDFIKKMDNIIEEIEIEIVLKILEA